MANQPDAASEADQPGQESPAAPERDGSPLELLVDEIERTCAVCDKTIERGVEYVQAAYGPVHSEPCSHQPKVLGDEDTGTFI